MSFEKELSSNELDQVGSFIEILSYSSYALIDSVLNKLSSLDQTEPV